MTQQPNPDPVYPDPAAPSYPTYPPTTPLPHSGAPASPNDAPAAPSSWNAAPPPNYPPPAYHAPAGQNAWQDNLGTIGASGPMTPAQERNWAMLSHLIPLVCFVLSAGTLGFVAALVIYLMYKDRGPFVRAAAANSLNVQIITGIGLLVSAILMLLLIGFITYPVICVWAIVVHIIAATKANAGEWYNPPLTPRIIKEPRPGPM